MDLTTLLDILNSSVHYCSSGNYLPRIQQWFARRSAEFNECQYYAMRNSHKIYIPRTTVISDNDDDAYDDDDDDDDGDDDYVTLVPGSCVA